MSKEGKAPSVELVYKKGWVGLDGDPVWMT